MARWRLTAGHYIHVPGTEYEYKETNRETGQQMRKIYKVPRHLDPKTASDWNAWPDGPGYDGCIIVCWEGKGQGRDIVFEGMPTPDMDPLDDEARAVSATIPQKKPEFAHMSMSEGVLEEIMRQMGQAIASGIPHAASTGGVSQTEFDKLKEMVTQLAEQNTELQAQLAEKPRRI